MTKHKTSCAYQQNPRARCTCGVKTLGKPFTHWQDMADELIMRDLLMAIRCYSGTHAAISQQIAAARLHALAEAYDPELKVKVEQQLDNQVEGLNSLLAAIRGK